MYAVAAAHPRAMEAGLRVLEEGGDACDAAVAVSLALGVAEPFYSGLGGGGVALLWRAKGGRLLFLDFHNQCSRHARPDMFPCDGEGKHVGLDHNRGHRSVHVPGLLRGLEAIHAGFGRAPWGRLFEDAVALAEGGVSVYPLWCLLQSDERFLELAQAYPELARLHTEGGRLLAEGFLLRQPDLARTLRRLAEEGPALFYEGALGAALCEEMGRGGGLIDAEDLAAYAVRRPEPLTGAYRGLAYLTAPLPASGLLLVQVLNLLECALPRWEEAGENARRLAFAKAARAAYRDRFALYGDPAHADVPVERLKSRAYAAELAERECMGAPHGPVAGPRGPHAHDRGAGSTTHFTIVDAEGNAVCHTQTLGQAFGSGVVVPGTGVLLNNHMNWMDPRPGRPNAPGPGKRPMAGYAPTLVFEKGRLRLAVGSPGSYRIPTAVAQVVLNRFGRGMPLQEAVSAPRMHTDAGPLEAEEGVLNPELHGMLEGAGFEVETLPYPSHYFGGVHAVEIREDGALAAAADPRRAGAARVAG